MEFRPIKIQAVVETKTMLLTEEQLRTAVEEFLDTLKRLNLAVLGVEPKQVGAVDQSKVECLEYFS